MLVPGNGECLHSNRAANKQHAAGIVSPSGTLNVEASKQTQVFGHASRWIRRVLRVASRGFHTGVVSVKKVDIDSRILMSISNLT